MVIIKQSKPLFTLVFCLVYQRMAGNVLVAPATNVVPAPPLSGSWTNLAAAADADEESAAVSAFGCLTGGRKRFTCVGQPAEPQRLLFSFGALANVDCGALSSITLQWRGRFTVSAGNCANAYVNYYRAHAPSLGFASQQRTPPPTRARSWPSLASCTCCRRRAPCRRRRRQAWRRRPPATASRRAAPPVATTAPSRLRSAPISLAPSCLRSPSSLWSCCGVGDKVAAARRLPAMMAAIALQSLLAMRAT